MRRTLRLAVFLASSASIAACNMPTAPHSSACNAKVAGACVSSKDYINPLGDYINPLGRSDSTSDTTSHGGSGL